MASFNIHLAIGKRYTEKNMIKDLKSFYNGILGPDLAKEKNISHYAGIRDKRDLLLYLKIKVQLPKFLLENDISSDYMKGTFIHLITDYVFYNDLIDREYLRKNTYQNFEKDLYYSYDYVNEYIMKKYDLSVIDYDNKVNANNLINESKKVLLNETSLNNLLEQNKLDIFIERISSINLESYREKIIHYNSNILP